MAQQQLQQQRLPDMLLPYMMNRAGTMLVQRTILKHEADRLHLEVSDADLARELRTGQFARYIFPDGVYIGDDKYISFVQTYFNMSRSDFETQVKNDMELKRLQALVTGGVVVSDSAVREAVTAAGTKVKVRLCSSLGRRHPQDHQSQRRRPSSLLQDQCREVCDGGSRDAEDRICELRRIEPGGW